MTLRKLELSRVLVYAGRDSRTQFRVDGVRQEVVDQYAQALKDGAVFPPIDVFFDGTDYWLVDGFHRVEAYRRRKVKTVSANVYEGTLREAMLYAMQANLRHGLPATRADKRKAVETMLLDDVWTSWSNREIGRQCGVDGTTVAAMRKELGLTSTKRTTMRGGKVVVIETSNIGAKATAGILQSETESEARSAEQNDAFTEPTDKDRVAADKAAEMYGWSLDDALAYVTCLRSKREQDARRREDRKAEQERLRKQVARKLRRDLPEQKRKRIQTGLQDVYELARQYGVPASVVLDVVKLDAKKER
jgi:hypothetical protein